MDRDLVNADDSVHVGVKHDEDLLQVHHILLGQVPLGGFLRDSNVPLKQLRRHKGSQKVLNPKPF